MTRLASLPLRFRLVAGFSVVMLVVLSAAGSFVYWRVQYALDRGLDRQLAQSATTLGPLVATDGSVADRQAADATGVGWQTLTTAGVVVARGGPAPAAPLVAVGTLSDAADGPETRDVGDLLPVSRDPVRLRVQEVSPGIGLVVLVRRDARDEALRELLLQLALAGAGALVLTAVVGERLARFALLPVERYRRRAGDIAAGATGVRLEVPPGRDDEVTRLGHTLNDMLGELERSLDRERRFVDEASHELRTPLTLLTSRIQLARRRPRDVAEHEHVLHELEIDVGRLTDLAEQLLALGTPDPGGEASADLVPLLTRVVLLHDDVRVDVPHHPVRVSLHPVAAERVLTNLLHNSRTHGAAPVAATVDTPAGHDGRLWGRLTVTDSGVGMPADLLDTATDRFTRAPRSRALPGAGLGLSLVRKLVEDAEGELLLCHAGLHRRYGTASGVVCEHGPEMTVTVVLPPASVSTS